MLVDEDEWALLDSAAGQVGGLSVAGWLGLVASDAAASRPLISGEQYGRVWELTRALRRVGVNLNQIAAKLNAGGQVEGMELVASLAALDQVLGQSSELLGVMTEVMRSPRRAGAGHRGSAATKADEGVEGGADATGAKAASVPGDAAGGGSAR